MTDWDSDPELKALRDEFEASFPARRRLLAALEARLRAPGSPDFEAACKELRVLAHNLAGTAPTYGFPVIGQIAALIDDSISLGAVLSSGQGTGFASLLGRALENEAGIGRNEIEKLTSFARSLASAASS